MPGPSFPLVAQIGRVPSMVVPLDRPQERRFQRLSERLIAVDVHQHPLVLTESLDDLADYLRSNAYSWGYQAAARGGWACVGTANTLTCLAKNGEASFSDFHDLVDEVALMLADMSKHPDEVVKVSTVQDILAAKDSGRVGFLPSLEHLAIGHDLHRVDVLYGLGVRVAGLTYTRRNAIGDGQSETSNSGLSDFGVEVVRRMNDLGMLIDVSHAGHQTALDAIRFSSVPLVFSHNAAYTIRPTSRSRRDDELVACAEAGGLVCITAVPNALSDDPRQDINCVLDHYDYLIRLVGADHVGIGTDTLVGDHVGFHLTMSGRDKPKSSLPAPYLDGLESPADGRNIIRGLIARGHPDSVVEKVAGLNAVNLIGHVIG